MENSNFYLLNGKLFIVHEEEISISASAAPSVTGPITSSFRISSCVYLGEAQSAPVSGSMRFLLSAGVWKATGPPTWTAICSFASRCRLRRRAGMSSVAASQPVRPVTWSTVRTYGPIGGDVSAPS